MIEIKTTMNTILHKLYEEIFEGEWALTQQWIYYTDKFGNQHKNIGLRYVRYSESFFGFIRHFGNESYFPLMIFREEPIPDDKWDSDLELFVPWAKQRGFTVSELLALSDVFNGRIKDNKNPLVAVLEERIGKIVDIAYEIGRYKSRPTP